MRNKEGYNLFTLQIEDDQKMTQIGRPCPTGATTTHKSPQVIPCVSAI